jgi:hypothetical protein
MEITNLHVVATAEPIVELDRLGDEIAELAAHLDAATARLLELIREFDARGGWNHGFRSCAHWLGWRVGMKLGAGREHVRVARALGSLPRLADALVLLAEAALHHGLDPGAPGERYQVVVHVDAPVLAYPEAPGQSVLDGGTHVPAETSQRLACDATRVIMRHDPDGRVVEVGARTRTIPPAIRRALHHRDRGCRFPGCGLPFGQGHHIRHWVHGGPTTLSNLAMLCRRHHRAVHEEGYRVERHADGALSFRRPDGRLLPDVPPPPAVPHDPSYALRAKNEASGLRVHARTACPGWQGERLDVGWAIDVLHPRALTPARSAT